MKNSKKNSFVKDVVNALHVKSSVKAGLVNSVGGIGGLGGDFCLTCGLGGVTKPVLKP
jgi:hypothetical protein